jgi:hypothetical protein
LFDLLSSFQVAKHQSFTTAGTVSISVVGIGKGMIELNKAEDEVQRQEAQTFRRRPKTKEKLSSSWSVTS